MPSLQWLGAIPEEPSTASYLASILKEGLTNYMQAKQKGMEMAPRLLSIISTLPYKQKQMELAEERLDLYKKQLENVDKTQKIKLADMITDLARHLTPEGREMLAETPEIKALFDDVYGADVSDALKEMQEDVEEPTIRASDIKEAAKLIPLWDKLLPGDWSAAAKTVKQLRKKMVEQRLSKTKPIRKRSGEEKVIFGVRYRRGKDGKWYRVE